MKNTLLSVLFLALAAMPAFAQDNAQTRQKIQQLDQALTAALPYATQASPVPYVNIGLLKNAVENVLLKHPFAKYETLYQQLTPAIKPYLAYRLQRAPLSEEEMTVLLQSFETLSQQNKSIVKMILSSLNIRAVVAQETCQQLQEYIERQKALPYFSDIQLAENIFPDSMVDFLGPHRMEILLKQVFQARLAQHPLSQDESAFIAIMMDLSEENTRTIETILRNAHL